jgi:serine protease inhibitor
MCKKSRIAEIVKRDNRIRSVQRVLPALTSAVYFEGSWIEEFLKKKTATSRFHLSPGNGVEVPMIFRREKDTVPVYGEPGDLRVLQMPMVTEDRSPS